jgi:predicted lipoprotein with Yx(FWY)xxD motif
VKRAAVVPFLALLVTAGCGGASKAMATGAASSGASAAVATPAASTGTTITLRPSRYGRMLFSSKRQAIYVFQRDRPGRSNCYGECAKSWPPVYTTGRPQAGPGVRMALLGMAKRRDGRLQVTYAGKPLYYYANEGPGQVECHNVELNGGFWWVVGPDGKRRP